MKKKNNVLFDMNEAGLKKYMFDGISTDLVTGEEEWVTQGSVLVESQKDLKAKVDKLARGIGKRFKISSYILAS